MQPIAGWEMGVGEDRRGDEGPTGEETVAHDVGVASPFADERRQIESLSSGVVTATTAG